MDLSALIFAALKSAKTANERIDALPLPMVFKGTLGTGGTISTLPTASSENEGYVYIVISDGTYAGQSAKAGDLFVSDGTSWVLVPSADEPSPIDDSVISTALTWSSKKISDECKIKSFAYTGTGGSGFDITFPKKPTLFAIYRNTDSTSNCVYSDLIPTTIKFFAINQTSSGASFVRLLVESSFDDITNKLSLTGTNSQYLNSINVKFTVYYI